MLGESFFSAITDEKPERIMFSQPIMGTSWGGGEPALSNPSTDAQTTSIPIGKKLDGRESVASEPHDYDDLPEEVKKFVSDRYGRKKPERTAIQKLEGKHMLSLILYLDNMAPVIKTDIYNDVARSSSMLERIDDLEEMRIVKIYATGRTNNKVVTMTDKGRKVAKIVREMVSIAEDNR